MAFTKHLLGRFQVVATARDIPYTQIYLRMYVHMSKFRLSVCLHAPVTIYVHLERSARIDRNDAPGTRVITSRFCNESQLHKRVRDCSRKKNIYIYILNIHVEIMENNARSSDWNCNRSFELLILRLLCVHIFSVLCFFWRKSQIWWLLRDVHSNNDFVFHMYVRARYSWYLKLFNWHEEG